MQANLVTLIRIFLVFLVIGLYKVNTIACGVAVLLTIATLYMDALDGIIARRLGIESDLGAMFDIAGDRIVENVFWVYFVPQSAWSASGLRPSSSPGVSSSTGCGCSPLWTRARPHSAVRR